LKGAKAFPKAAWGKCRGSGLREKKLYHRKFLLDNPLDGVIQWLPEIAAWIGRCGGIVV